MQTPIYDWTSKISVKPYKCQNTSQVHGLKKTVAERHNNHILMPRLLEKKTIGIWLENVI